MRLTRDPWSLTGRDEFMVVCDPGRLADMVRARFPDLEVITQDTYLSGIESLAQRSVRGLLVGVDPAVRKLPQAIAGLRKAAGERPPLVLCCRPAAEPLARQALSAGASDYLIYPPRPEELDRAFGLNGGAVEAGIETPAAAVPTCEELVGLAQVLAGISEGRSATLERLCRFLAEAMRTSSVRIRTAGEEASVGRSLNDPVLVEGITLGRQTIGQVLIGPREKAPFSTAEVEKLRHYARLIACLLVAAEQQRQWHTLAMMDEVTGLPNRRYLLQALEKLLERAAQQRFSVTVLLFDLDGFKHFNDVYGHAAGDQILRETAQLFRRHCRRHDLVARYGGDEFVVVFWDADEPRVLGSKHPTDVLAVLRRVKKALLSHAFPKLGPEATGCITISGGLATFPWDARDVEGLLERADEALLHAKREGKDRIYLVGSQRESPESETP